MVKQVSEVFDIDMQELDELLVIVYKIYGFDFTGYSRASLKRRIAHVMSKFNMTFFTLKQQLVNQPSFYQLFLNEITVNVTEMFRDVSFYQAVARDVIPYLSSYPGIKVWNAGCSTGQETYSFAIMLKEHGLLNRSFLYGTDINTTVIETATEGIYPAVNLKTYSKNYLEAGGKSTLADHYHAAYDHVIMNNELKSRILFSVHNLVSDNVFNEFQLVVCRNVLIYFEPRLQERVTSLLYDSLCPLGFLCLGSKEVIHSETIRKKFKVVNSKQKIYQKIA
jgi:chemotaxis protein methyltransferase CheR